MNEQTKTSDAHYTLPEPFQGRIVLERIKEDVTAYKKDLYGMAQDSVIQLVETADERVPYKKGKIVKLAPDAFGERFHRYYGKDRSSYPQIGDTVLFTPNQDFKLDPSGKYSIISDEHVIAYYKGN